MAFAYPLDESYQQQPDSIASDYALLLDFLDKRDAEQRQAPEPDILPPDWMVPRGAPKAQDQGTIESILHYLGYIDRPRNSIATAVQYGMSPDQNKTALSGLAKGLTGSVHTSFGDILGIGPGTEKDDTGTWLLKNGIRLGLDATLDPALALGKAGKAAKGLEAYKAASEALYGSAIGRSILHGVSAHRTAEFSELLSAVMRAKNERFLPQMEEFTKLLGEEPELLNKMGLTKEEARHLFEAEGRTLTPNVTPGKVESLPEGRLRDIYQSVASQDKTARDALNELRDLVGLEGVGNVEGINYVPRTLTETGRRELASEVGAQTATGGSSLDASRVLKKVVSPSGNPITVNGKPVITTEGHPLSGLENRFGRWYWKFPGGEGRVQLIEPTLKDVVESGIVSEKRFVPGTIESFMVHGNKIENERAFLEFFSQNIKPLEEIQAGGPGWLTKVETALDLKTLPKDWRALDIPGLGNYAAPKWAATALEKQSKNLFDPSTSLGMLEQLGQAALDTKAGSLLREGTTWWKRNVLGLHLGYYLGNVASNIPQMYISGEVPAYMIPTRMAQAVKVAAGKGEDVLPGLSNAQFAKELQNRDVFTAATWAGSEAGDILQEAVKGPGRVRRAADYLPEFLQPVGKAAATAGEAYGNLNTKALRYAGGQSEANSRIGVIIDYLKRNNVDFTNMSAADKASWLDKAADFGKTALIDYSQVTPFESMLRSSVFPFYPWMRGITANTLKAVTENPARLGRIDRAIETAFMPMDPTDYALMQDWQKENAPTRGVFGTTWDKIYQDVGKALPFLPQDWFSRRPEGDRMALIGRYLPWGNIEQALSRPSDTLQSMVNPLFKIPLELGYANKSSFTNKDIDSISGGFPGSVVNPLLGRPYQLATRRTMGVQLPAAWQYLLESSPPGRMVGSLSELGRGAGLWEDPYRADTNPFESTSWFISGGKTYPFDATKALMTKQMKDRKTIQDIRGKLNFAAAKGDARGIEHYLNLLNQAQADQAGALRASGMTD